MSNIKILFSILFIPALLLPIFYILQQLNNFENIILLDSYFFIIVFINSFLIYFGFSNYKNYQNKLIYNVKFNFLKESFILMAMCGTTIGLITIWASVGLTDGELNGDAWSRLGLSIGVCLISDLYGIVLYFSTFLLENIIKRKTQLDEKIINKINSKVYLSFSLIILAIIFVGIIFFITLPIAGISFISLISSLYYIPIYILILLFVLSYLIIGTNFNYILKSIFNKKIEIKYIKDTLFYLKKLSRIVLILIGIIFLSSMVLISLSFNKSYDYTTYDYTQSLGIYFSNIYLSFFICITYIIFLRGFLFRLNIELIEKNQISIDYDHLFIYKYCIPIYIFMWITMGFSFLIIFFK